MFLFPHYQFPFSVSLYVCRHPTVILTLSDYPHFALPINFLLCPTLFLLCPQIISDDNTIYTPCAILELSGTMPESADKVGFLLCAGTIPESYQFFLCAEHRYARFYPYQNTTNICTISFKRPHSDCLAPYKATVLSCIHEIVVCVWENEAYELLSFVDQYFIKCVCVMYTLSCIHAKTKLMDSASF